MAICGKDASITIGVTNASAYSFTIEMSSIITEIRAFELTTATPGEYAPVIACSQEGSVTVESYERIDLEPGDAVDITADIGTESWDLACKMEEVSINVDVTKPVPFVTKFYVTAINP